MKLLAYKKILITACVLTTTLATAQDEGFIYGKIFTEDGKNYEGPIRWGKEEIYWTDIFNASKERNENLRFLSDREQDLLDEKNSEWFTVDNRWTSWVSTKNWTRENDYVHQFACQFGDIKAIVPMGRKYVELELRNGKKIELSGEGYNDVGLDLRITDADLGQVDVDWSRIEKIEFSETPSKLDTKFGQPLYGTVEAFGDKFTGYIQWDKDERVTTDKLDGDSDDGNLSIEFSKIRSIERKGHQSQVTLKSGRSLYMDGSNDVSSGNRGIIVMNKEFPAVIIPWSEFDKVTFDDKNPGPIASFKDFGSQKELNGKVTTRDGKSFSGKLIYDLDESFDYELLQGKQGEFEFATPFRSVKRISLTSSHRATVELLSGKKIVLDDAQDVAENNQGVLIFSKDDANPKYVPWDNVAEIEFR
jgi:hypothetical protein